ncbi:UDP-N-acetylmuramate dehydrogenase [Gemmatimonas sp.]|jgi:UDP-N-acetylmuramate dehydrogenase|uniref:UDP-N-acetylmuramate dehydrogenase n=1 Tax=Gemmatimonas sp. TaxID=1962908 RepID=UPI0037BEB464
MTPTQIADALVAASVNAFASTPLDRSRLQLCAPLAPYTTFRIGGPADVLLEAQTADELATAITAAKLAGVPWFVLGLGANVLIGDRGIRGLVIRNAAAAHTISPEGKLWSESGAVMQDLVLDTVRAGWSGLEHYIGIPSTVGGALWQNLHFLSPAPERDRTMFIAEVFESCEILAVEGDRRVVDAGYIKFGYDDTVFHHRRDVVLSATFQLTKGDPARLHQILQENLSWRGSRHPWLQVHPSAGSIFKKIEGVGAGRLIDQCGLKGFRVGDAQISHIHANILVNLGHATAADVRALVAHAQAAVTKQFGYELQPEVGFIGEF